MSEERPADGTIREGVLDGLRKFLETRDLSFRQFVEVALYDPVDGYYATAKKRIGEGGDYITSPLISPVFGFGLSRLAAQFVDRLEGGLCSIVDIGCGDGTLIRQIAGELEKKGHDFRAFGVDRALQRTVPDRLVTYVADLSEVPSDRPAFVLSNELFDAIPFARVVMREERLSELFVTEADAGVLEWDERPAGEELVNYFATRGVKLAVGQFADVTPAWGELYGRIAAHFDRAMVVTFDYGFERRKLYDVRIRRYGTAAAYSNHQVHRDLLARPGEQDLTAHIDFDDLVDAGKGRGYLTLHFSRQASFLVSLGVFEHPLFRPVDELQASTMEELTEVLDRRQRAQRLVLPEGIGEDIKTLVQGRGIPLEGWMFQVDPFARK
jgi:SAM-dependent MidA family methyltransferase